MVVDFFRDFMLDTFIIVKQSLYRLISPPANAAERVMAASEGFLRTFKLTTVSPATVCWYEMR